MKHKRHLARFIYERLGLGKKGIFPKEILAVLVEFAERQEFEAKASVGGE